MPVPVVSKALLFALFVLLRRAPPELDDTAWGTPRHRLLLFVPAGIGVVLPITLVRGEWLLIGAALTHGTLVTIAATACLIVRLDRGGLPMAEPSVQLRTYRAQTPLLGATPTLAADLMGDVLSRQSGLHPLVSPVPSAP